MGFLSVLRSRNSTYILAIGLLVFVGMVLLSQNLRNTNHGHIKNPQILQDTSQTKMSQLNKEGQSEDHSKFINDYSRVSVPQKAVDIRNTNFKEQAIVEPATPVHKPNKSMYACDYKSECWRLQNFLENWNGKKPKAAVYILVRSEDAPELRKTLQDLQTNFLTKYPYPVIIFYEKEFISLIPDIRRNNTKTNLFFQEVQFEAIYPSFLHPPAAKTFECPWNIGYRHMCRFHSKIVYDLPIMKNLEYYLRLDAHSYITKPVPYDLFNHMRDNNLVYGYACMDNDLPECVVDLRESIKLFVKVKHITPQFMHKLDGLKIFYNNFELARIDFFTGKQYQNYMNFIDQLGGIYHNRWGDAPVKSFAVSIFVPENQTRHIYDLEYYHRNIRCAKALASAPTSNKMLVLILVLALGALLSDSVLRTSCYIRPNEKLDEHDEKRHIVVRIATPAPPVQGERTNMTSDLAHCDVMTCAPQLQQNRLWVNFTLNCRGRCCLLIPI